MKTIECNYFSLPVPDYTVKKLTGGYFCELDFVFGFFKGTIRIETGDYDDEIKKRHPDFADYFRAEVLSYNYIRSPKMEESCLGKYRLCYCQQDNKLAAAIELSKYQYLKFIVQYEKSNFLLEEIKEIFNAAGWQEDEIKAHLSAISADAEKLTEKDLQQYIFSVLKSLTIKSKWLEKEEKANDQANARAKIAASQRRERHLQSYRSEQQQASDPFHLRHYPKHFATLENTLAGHFGNLPDITRRGIDNNARLSINFQMLDVDDYSQKGNTRFYGLPDLPPELEYPRFDEKGEHFHLYKFVAQINFDECQGLCDFLPERGILYFFIKSQYHFDEGMNYPHKIFYYAGDTQNLRSAKALNIPIERIYDVKQGYEPKYGARPARVNITARPVILKNAFHANEDEDTEYPHEIDYPPIIYGLPNDQIEKIIYTVGYGVNCINGQLYQGYDGSPCFRAAQLFGGKAEDYMMLLITSGSPEINQFMYEDNDDLYFVIAKEKLKNLDFSQVYCSNTWWWRNGAGEDEKYWQGC